jgi:hypothetical protein
MRKALLVTALLTVSWGLEAQRPRVSPHEVHDYTLDGSKISFDYGRPSKRGREIWGTLVPYGKWWMPGADEATILTTQDPLVLGGTLEVPAGKHTLYALPDPNVMKLIVNKQVGQFHTSYTPDMDLGRVDLTLRKLTEPVETLTYKVDAVPEGGGLLKLIWDDREYSVSVALKK